ncbi:MAG: hypothetical protein WDO24_10975 [Pseudomonadota bacterium]
MDRRAVRRALRRGHGQGLFPRRGIDITGILASQGGGTSVRNVLASATPYGEVALSAAIAARREGLPLIIVNTGTRHVAEFVWGDHAGVSGAHDPGFRRPQDRLHQSEIGHRDAAHHGAAGQRVGGRCGAARLDRRATDPA